VYIHSLSHKKLVDRDRTGDLLNNTVRKLQGQQVSEKNAPTYYPYRKFSFDWKLTSKSKLEGNQSHNILDGFLILDFQLKNGYFRRKWQIEAKNRK